MLKTLIRGIGFVIVAMLFLAGLLPTSADAQNNQGPPPPTVSSGTSTSGTASPAPQTTQQTLSQQASTTSVANMAVNGAIGSSDSLFDSFSFPAAPQTTGTSFLPMVYHDVSPASGALSIRGVGVGAVYSRTVFSGSASGLGYSRITQTAGISASYGQDFGDWRYTAVLPVTRSSNNSGYAAFNNTSVGLAVVPVYHLLFEQVDHIALDVGGVLGGQYTAYDHPSALANGPIGLAGFANPASGQLGVLFKAAKSVAATTRLSLGASFVDNHNFTGDKALGQDTSATTADLGLDQRLSSTVSLSADLALVNSDQYNWGTDGTYGQGALALSARLSPRASLSLQVNRTFANSRWSTTSGTINFVWWLS